MSLRGRLRRGSVEIPLEAAKRPRQLEIASSLTTVHSSQRHYGERMLEKLKEELVELRKRLKNIKLNSRSSE